MCSKILNSNKREAPVETGAVLPKLTAYEKIFIIVFFLLIQISKQNFIAAVKEIQNAVKAPLKQNTDAAFIYNSMTKKPPCL